LAVLALCAGLVAAPTLAAGQAPARQAEAKAAAQERKRLQAERKVAEAEIDRLGAVLVDAAIHTQAAETALAESTARLDAAIEALDTATLAGRTAQKKAAALVAAALTVPTETQARALALAAANAELARMNRAARAEAEAANLRGAIETERQAWLMTSTALAAEHDRLRDLLDARQARFGAITTAYAEADRRAKRLATNSGTLDRLAHSSRPHAPASLLTKAPSGRLPAVGKITHAYSPGARRNGVRMATAPSAVVLAPADGEIIFADLFRSYGNVLILDIGHDYAVVLAGVDRIHVAGGRRVRAGEPIAQMAKNGRDGDLYWEVRRHGQPIDPLAWAKGHRGAEANRGKKDDQRPQRTKGAAR
jgi:septal ring factor EnvC (AmiA/AmiB activator)